MARQERGQSERPHSRICQEGLNVFEKLFPIERCGKSLAVATLDLKFVIGIVKRAIRRTRIDKQNLAAGLLGNFLRDIKPRYQGHNQIYD